MYPHPPYSGYTWPLTQHMGVVNERNLYHILWAAATYSDSPDPAAEINNYIIANNLVTANIRRDSGQPDAWRDYQQILSELGLIFSTGVLQRITLTPLGLAYLDGALGFSEIVTMQALRYQYPNGHKLVIDRSLRVMLQGTPVEGVTSLAKLQQMMGVNVQPGILIWKILRQLKEVGEAGRLTINEIQTYAMRCTTNLDKSFTVDAIVNYRHNVLSLEPLERARRNAQDWIKFLIKTPIFQGQSGPNAYVQISDYGADHLAEIDDICSRLEQDSTRWFPGALSRPDRLAWYAWYGGVDLAVSLVPKLEGDSSFELSREFQGGTEDDQDEFIGVRSEGSQINLRDFDPQSFLSTDSNIRSGSGTTIESSYNAGLANRQHRLHDLMVILIASTCRSKGAIVWDDPNTVDLLAEYEGLEFIIEVKSITSKNFIRRIRYALGQVLYYDYLRSTQSQLPRRKVIAVAANVPDSSWCVPFLNNHLDIDLISLRGNTPHVHSNQPRAQRLFSSA